MTEADWQAILAVGDRALFAYRLRKARLDSGEEQAEFIEGSGVSQQTLSEWERGEKVHITTAMLHTAAHLLATSAARLLQRPADAHSESGRVFWIAVEAELAARQTRGLRLTVAEVLARATAPME